MRIIDADVLLDEFNKREAEPEYQHEGEDWYCGLISGEELVRKAPTIESEQRWIPCTPDTMPKPMQKVLITFEEYDQLWVTSAKFIYYRKTLQWDWDFGSCGEVKAWMPLPEPYGGDK